MSLFSFFFGSKTSSPRQEEPAAPDISPEEARSRIGTLARNRWADARPLYDKISGKHKKAVASSYWPYVDATRDLIEVFPPKGPEARDIRESALDAMDAEDAAISLEMTIETLHSDIKHLARALDARPKELSVFLSRADDLKTALLFRDDNLDF
jgi:hypothetical protein